MYQLQDCQGANVKSSRQLFMFLFLHEQQLTQTFTNVEITLRIDLSMMVSNCSGVRTFSKMGIIKSVLQQRLNMSSLMSIERDVLRAIDFDDAIDDFARMKARRRLRCRRSLKLKLLQPSTCGDCECKLHNSSFQRQIN